MTKTQMIQAVRGYDEAMLLVEEMRKAAASSSDDALLGLIERITAASRAATVEDVIIDLKDFDQTEAAEIIKANY